MAKQLTGKRVKFEVELYWRGKTRIPSVNILYSGDNYEGLPPEISTSEFQKGCNDLCKQLVEAGELD